MRQLIPLITIIENLQVDVKHKIKKMVNFLIGHKTNRMFPPAIDIIPTSLAVAYSMGK